MQTGYAARKKTTNINIKYTIEHPNDPEFTHQDGQIIKGVRHCLIKMQPGESVVALLDVHLDGLDIEAEPLLHLDTVKRTAHHYGFKLVPLVPIRKKKDTQT